MKRSAHAAYLATVVVLAAAHLGTGWAIGAGVPTTTPPVAAEPPSTDPGPGAPATESGVTSGSGRTAAASPSVPDDLPAPFRDWDVALDPVPDVEGTYRLSFDSPLLELRETALVWLPTDFTFGHGSWPVVLYLHGTRGTSVDPAVDPVTRELARSGADVPFLSPATGPATTPTSVGFHETRDRHDFVVVAPDAGPLPWCASCNWVDGPGERGVLADSYLHDELIPLVGAVLGTRTDRAGVGVVGHSMGGGGALIQGFRHPDRFAFAGSSSGTLNTYDDPASTTQVRWAYWNRTQGFDPALVNEVAIRNFNLLDLVPNVVGVGTELVAVIGDACLDPETSDEGSCAGATPANDTGNFAQEVYQRYGNNQLTAARLVQAGAPLAYVTREGNHGIFTSTFRRYFLDRLNATFAAPPETPVRFAYRTADTDFDVWGWRVAVERPTDEFLHLSGARTDGREVLVGGSGVVTLTTPPVFRPRSVHRVVVTPVGGEARTHEVTADEQGRLRIVVDLGVTHDVDERDALVDAGVYPIAQARVEVEP